MKTGIGCAVLLCLMGSMAGAAASGNIAGSIESDPIDFDSFELWGDVDDDCVLSNMTEDRFSGRSSARWYRQEWLEVITKTYHYKHANKGCDCQVTNETYKSTEDHWAGADDNLDNVRYEPPPAHR